VIDKHLTLEALISSNNNVWGEFHMHPLKTNMRLATAAAAQACGGLLSQEEGEQLRYADMLIDVSKNCNSLWCQVIQDEDENISKLGFLFMKYYTEADPKGAVEWLYPGGQLDFSATIFCSNNASVDMWNAIAQGMISSVEHTLRSIDSFSKVDVPKGHLKKMLNATLLNGFWKNGVPGHELILKVGNICLVTHAINGLGLANNSRVHIIATHRYCVKVLTVGDCAKRNIRIHRISFKFRLPYG
jgi:hypothetical protein